MTVIDLQATIGLLLSRLLMLTVTGFSMVSFTQYLVVKFQETVSFSPFPQIFEFGGRLLGDGKIFFRPPKLWTRFTPLGVIMLFARTTVFLYNF